MANYQLTQTGAQVQNLLNDIGNKAPTASPALTGVPTAPTAAVGTDTTQIATTAFVNNTIDSLGITGTLPVSKGGTGLTATEDGKALIGSGTTGFTFRNIYTKSVTGNLDWSDATGPYLLTKAALAFWNGAFSNNSSNISKLGTITSGQWKGTTIAVSYGGTGKSSFTGNRLIFSPDTSTVDNAAKIYVKNETNADAYMAINDTGIVSGYNFQVTGNSNFKGGAKFWGTVELGLSTGSEGQIIRGGRSSSWYNGRDKAMLALTNDDYYNVFASIKAGNSTEAATDRGSWDIGTTGYTSSPHKFKLIFSYITDDLYTNGTSASSPSAKICFTKDGDIEANNFIGNMKRPGKSSAWWQGRDKTIISMTSNDTGYNPFMSIRADGNGTDSTITGTWDIGVNKYNSNYQNELIFSYITDTAYDNQTNAAPSNQIRFKQNGTIKTTNIEATNKATIGTFGTFNNTLQVYGKASFDNDIEIEGNLIGINETCNIGDVGWEWNNIYANNYIGSATLNGTPTAPTAVAGTNTTQIATTAFVQTSIADKVDKEAGKRLSTNDFTDSDKNLLEAGCIETKNHFNFETDIILGKNGTGGSSSIRAITVALNTGGGKSVVSVKNLPPNLKYQVWGYNDGNFTSPTNYTTTWIEKRGQSTIVAKPYVRVLFGTVNNATITMADFEGLELQVEEGEQKTDYAPKYTAFDYVARNRSYPVHLKVCSYNVGMYSNGISTDTPAADALENMSGFLGANNFDILGIQEGRSYVNGTNADETTYNDYFISQKSLLNNCAIKSQFVLKDIGEGTFTAGSRKYVYATAIIGNKEVFIINVHLALTATDRASNYTELLALLKAHEYFIVFGDFNAAIDYNTGVEEQAQAEYNNLINAGYTVANGGRWGLLTTIGTQTKYPDNICVSSNIKMITSKTANVYATMNSDHIPIIAELVV